MAPALAIGGWAAAMVAVLAAAIARRTLVGRMELVARACHELRGPLTAVRLGLESGGRAQALTPARMRALDLELGRAALAIDDLAETEAGRRTAGTFEEVDLLALLADSVEAWRPCAEVRGGSIELKWIGAPVSVLGDRLRLAQAVANLVLNGLEHGGGRVQVKVAVGESGETAVRIEFVDDGPGLCAPIAELARRGRRSRGLHGHGLAVANAVAVAHGGRLGSAPSEFGARIVLELPLPVGVRAGIATRRS